MLTFQLQQVPAPQVVCIGAHCDDIEIGCGGTLSALAEAYPAAHFHCWVFSGNDVRQRESDQCLRVLLGEGRYSLQVFGHRDGFFPTEWARIKETLSRLSQSFKADMVFTHTKDESHQDHRTLNELTWNHFRNHLVLEYEIVKYEGDLGRPNFYVPLSTAQHERKLQALMSAFPSQFSKPWFTRSTFEAITRLRGIESLAISGHAEAFFVRKAVCNQLAPPEHPKF